MKTLLVAGGSGGHLMPALTLAEHLQKRGSCSILSTTRPLDRTLAAISQVEWMTVDLERFTPVWRWLLPGYTVHQLRAMRRVWAVLRQTKPDIVVGFGGYLSAVGVVAARLHGLPTVLHEQNLLPGKANRFLSRIANAVGVSFPETRGHLPRRVEVEVTGNPLRPNLRKIPVDEARAFFSFDSERPVLFVLGGSQGSGAINRLAVGMWEALSPEERQGLQVIHVTGRADFSEIQETYRRLGMPARVCEFFHEMHLAYAAATLCLSRAGATTIAEMVALEVPAILIPYPHAGGHQRANARWMQDHGGAEVLEEEGLDSRQLWEKVSALLKSPERRVRMQAALRAQANGSAVERLGSLVERVAK